MSDAWAVEMDEMSAEAEDAERRYGGFASTHEALGVLSEEWDELRAAVHVNALASVRAEALQIAAVAIRLAAACRTGGPFAARSRGTSRDLR